jgi:hypothetical protein
MIQGLVNILLRLALIVILLISISQVARIIVTSHHSQAEGRILNLKENTVKLEKIIHSF